VPGGKRDGFVKKEQFGIPIRGHHNAVSPCEFQNARDPTPAFVGAHDLPFVVVQCAAPVAHHRSARLRPKNRA